MRRTSTTNFTRLLTGEVGLHYTRRAPLARRRRRREGRHLGAGRYDGNRCDDGDRSRRSSAAASICGLPLPLAHSSIWLRSAAGVANGDRNNPVANFYFGGFGNNYVDDGVVKRYREYYSLPGFQIDEISGRELRARR